MSWLSWKRPTPVPEPPRSPAPVEEPEAPRSSFTEKVEKWRAYFRAQRAAEPTLEQIEAVRERRRRAQMEAEEERIAAHIAYKNIFVEGEPLEGPEMPRTEGGLFAEVFEERRQDFHWWNRS